MKLPAICLPVLILASCATKPVASQPSSEEQGDMVDHILTYTVAMDPPPSSDNPAAITVPILRAPGLEAKYGKPKYDVMRDGSYIARYKWGKSVYLGILGTPRPGTTFGYDTRGTIDFMGSRHGYYVTGNEDPEITSKITRLTAPDGRSANYLVVFGGDRDDISIKGLEATVPKFGW
jgi:hypothetical protein